MSLYRNILKQAWNITWRHKYLWFFGLFVALLGNSGEYEIIARKLSLNASGNFLNFGGLAETGIFSGSALVNIGQLFKSEPFTVIMILVVWLVILVLLGFLLWLIIVSQAALVNNSATIITNKRKGQDIGIKDGVMAGTKYFWPVLGLNIVIKIIIYSAITLVSLPIIFTIARVGSSAELAPALSTGTNLLFILLFIIFIPAAVALSFIIKYAICYVVIKGSRFIDSIRQGWQLFIKNWLVSVEMAFLLFFINFLVGLGILLVVLILTIPFLFLAILAYKLISLTSFWLIVIIGLTFFLFIIIAGGAALATFQTASWTGLYIELTGRGGISKIVRIFNKKVQ